MKKLAKFLIFVTILHEVACEDVTTPKSTTCSDGDTYYFVPNKGDTSPQINKCDDFDSIKSEKRKTQICKFDGSTVVNGETIGPAKDVCPESCGTCKLTPTSAPSVPTPEPTLEKVVCKDLSKGKCKKQTGFCKWNKGEKKINDCQTKAKYKDACADYTSESECFSNYCKWDEVCLPLCDAKDEKKCKKIKVDTKKACKWKEIKNPDFKTCFDISPATDAPTPDKSTPAPTPMPAPVCSDGTTYYFKPSKGNTDDKFDACADLSKKPEEQITRICKFEDSGVKNGITYGPAKDVCRETCKTCDDGPSSKAPTRPTKAPTRPTERPTGCISSTSTRSDSYTKWRLWSEYQYLQEQPKWQILELEFYTSSDCTGTNFNTGEPIESGSASASANAQFGFDGKIGTKWGGRPEANEEIWLGMAFKSSLKILCVSFQDDLNKGRSTSKVKVQASNGNTWIDIATTEGVLVDHPLGTRHNLVISSGGPGPSPPPAPTCPTGPTPSPVAGPVCSDGTTYYFNSQRGEKFETCTKLSEKPEEQITRICKFKDSGVKNGITYGPAKDVCKKTCKTCSDSPPTPAPKPTGSRAPSTFKEDYVRNQTGDISYLKMKNRNPDCTDYTGKYFADVELEGNNSKNLRMNFEITSSANKCTLKSNNIPNHDVGGSVKPNLKLYTLDIPRNPVRNNFATYVEKIGGKLTLNGILLNGVDLDMDSAFCYNPAFTTKNNISLGTGADKCGIKDYNYYAIPAANPDNVALDKYSGHPYKGRYHYHGDNEALSFLKAADVQNENGSPVIGFAPDGFPIYGHWYLKKETNTLQKAIPSWQIKESFKKNGRVTHKDAKFPAPSIDTHELGIFVEDWEYVENSGDLDECNGMTDAFGNYGYYYTEKYPYGPRCSFGTPDDSFTKDGCEYDAGDSNCSRFSFVLEHPHEHGHTVTSKLITSDGAQVFSFFIMVSIAATSLVMISVL